MIFSILFFLVYFSVFLFLLLRWYLVAKIVNPVSADLPYVSVLLAVRNEEQNVVRCLEAFTKLDYPAGKLEVLIGEDNSSDNTLALVQGFIKDKPNFRCVLVRSQLGNAQAKANVIAHLAREASSNFLFITDADIVVPPTWVRTLLAPMAGSKVGVVAGVTTIRSDSVFAKVQALDWVFSLGLIQTLSELPQPVSALGNNMLIRRDAYGSVGGFENIPHSITEDVQIFKYLTRYGWGFANLYQPEALATSEPAPDLITVLQQRKRWMTGSMHLPIYAILPFVLHASFYLVLLTSVYYLSWQEMLSLAGIKILISFLFLNKGLNRLKIKSLIKYVFIFELYLLFLSFVLVPFYYLPININWKGRYYKK